MSFKRHGEIYPSDGSADPKTGASAHRSDEFPAGYSLAGRSPAEPASASPTVAEYATILWRRSTSFLRSAYSLTQNIGSGSTLANLFLCPADGVHLKDSMAPSLEREYSGTLMGPLLRSYYGLNLSVGLELVGFPISTALR